jgi:dipeptide/tripeptide permease
MLAAIACFLLGSGGAGSVVTALVLLAAGQGLLKPSVLAIAAQELGRGLDNARVAVCFALYGAIQAGAFAGGFGSGYGSTAHGPVTFTPVFTGAAFLLTMATVLATGLAAILQWSGNDARRLVQEAAPPVNAEAPALGGSDLDAALRRGPVPVGVRGAGVEPSKAALGAGVVIVAAAPLLVGLSAFSGVQFDAIEALRTDSGPLGREWLYSINPVVVIAATALGAIAMIIAALLVPRRVPVLYGIALGLLFFALGGAVLLLGDDKAALGSLLAGTVLTAIGEALVMPLAMSQVIGVSSGRTAPLWAAGWLVASSLLAMPAARVMGEAARGWLAVGMAGCLLAGIALAVLARRIQRAFFAS